MTHYAYLEDLYLNIQRLFFTYLHILIITFMFYIDI